MTRRAVTLAKVFGVGAALVGLALGACLVATDPKPATLPGRIARWLATPRAPGPPAPAPAAREPDVPPFSEVDFDDSGYAPAFAYTDPIRDPTSLREIRESVLGRNRRGIATLQARLDALRPGDPATPHATAQLHLLMGTLGMYEGA